MQSPRYFWDTPVFVSDGEQQVKSKLGMRHFPRSCVCRTGRASWPLLSACLLQGGRLLTASQYLQGTYIIVGILWRVAASWGWLHPTPLISLPGCCLLLSQAGKGCSLLPLVPSSYPLKAFK